MQHKARLQRLVSCCLNSILRKTGKIGDRPPLTHILLSLWPTGLPFCHSAPQCLCNLLLKFCAAQNIIPISGHPYFIVYRLPCIDHLKQPPISLSSLKIPVIQCQILVMRDDQPALLPFSIRFVTRPWVFTEMIDYLRPDQI